MKSFNRITKIRVNSWCKKLTQIINIQDWKKNRNLYAILLLNMLINNKLEEPFDKMPKDNDLPIISKTLVNSQLSSKFWKCAQKFLNVNSYNSKKLNNESDSKISNTYKNNLYNIELQNKYEDNNNTSNNKKEDIFDLNNINNNNININIKNNINNNNTNNINNINNNISNNYNIDTYLENLDNINIDNINLEDLKEIAEILQNDLKEKEIIISYQKEEEAKLKEKIGKLEEKLSSFISLEKKYI